jgi:hypothetical protein
MLLYRVMLLAFLFITLSAKGQVLQWSNPTKIRGSAVFSKVLGENKHGVYVLRYRNRFYTKSVILEKYNHLLSLDQSKIIDLKNARLTKIYLLQDSILLVKSQYNRLSATNTLIAQYYSYNLKPRGKPITLVETPSEEYGDKGDFRLRISDNQMLISLLYTEKDEEKNLVVHHRLYNAQLQLQRQKDWVMPYDATELYLQDYVVLNKGAIAILARHTQRKRKKILEKTHNLFYLNQHNELSDFVVSDTLDIKNAEIIYNRYADDFKVVGLYGFREEYGLEGILFYHLDSARKQGHLQINPFEKSLIEEANQNNINRKDIITEGFDLLKCIPRSDGGMLIVAEQKEIAQEDDIIMVNGIPQSTSKNIYNFNEILVMNYDNEGFLDWYKVITKNQTTVNDGGYYSSAVVYTNDKFIEIYYNDQLRSTGELMQYTIFNNGVSKSRKLLKLELDYVALIPRESKQVSSNKIIIPTLKNRRFALLKLIYN